MVIHDAGGMSPDIRNQADWLAGEGFLAATPDLFCLAGRVSPTEKLLPLSLTCLRSIARDLMARQGRAYDDVEAVRARLLRQPGCKGKVA